jgi:glycosyltransferase involved in cell wall biosynthesis
MSMKVAFFLFFPPTLWAPGGGEVQLAKTKEALEKLQVTVTLLDPWSRNHDFDVVHVFGSNYEVSSFIEAAKGIGLPVVVSTIAYSAKPAWQWKVWKWIDRCVPVPTTYRLRQRIYDQADRLIAASRSEAYQLAQGFRIDSRKIRLVPHGIDAKRFEVASPEPFTKRYGLRDFVLQVGRINRHKGQARLIQALDGTGLDVVFIGPLDYSDPEGVVEFERLLRSRPWVHYIGELSHDDPMLASAYAAARVHVLPSISESLGLSTLEAVAGGAAAVTGAYPPIREYLGDYVYYCNPKSVDSIRNAVLEAFTKGCKPGAREYVLSNFCWERVAERLLEVYRELVK